MYKCKLKSLLLYRFHIWLSDKKMHGEQYLFLLILIYVRIPSVFLCKDQLQNNSIYKTQFNLNLIDHFFDSSFLHYLGNKQIFMVIIAILFFSYDLNPLESILNTLLDESIGIHLHIIQDVEYNSYLSNYFV